MKGFFDSLKKNKTHTVDSIHQLIFPLKSQPIFTYVLNLRTK